jgi:hypothetical protein
MQENRVPKITYPYTLRLRAVEEDLEVSTETILASELQNGLQTTQTSRMSIRKESKIKLQSRSIEGY